MKTSDLRGFLDDLFFDYDAYKDKHPAPCPTCNGDGTYRGISDRDFLAALVVSLGGRTSDPVHGRECPSCNGSGVDWEITRTVAASHFADSWKELFEELLQRELAP